MKTQVSILTSEAGAAIDQSVFDYQTAVAAHTGGDWGVHRQLSYYNTLTYAEPVSGHTVADCYLMRVQLSGTNSDGTGDGVFTFPILDTGENVTVVGSVPAILVQPESQSVVSGGTAIFALIAASATPMTYQWYRDNVLIAGAVDSVYAIGETTPVSAGSYYAAVTNAYGSTASDAVTLTIN